MQRPICTLLSAILVIISTFHARGQTTRRVLFVGNSYIYTNDLPAIIEEIATNMGDTLIHDQSTPGGYTFALHLSNATTLSKIEEGIWDYVVLQEQSQLPSFPLDQVEEDCFPFAAELCDLIEANNPCARTIFFMTWGRKNGDSQNCANWPPVCTYEGMDDLLYERYLMMGEQNDEEVGPVGAVWRNIRENNDQIELYSPDESHPSLAGSYAAAVCFYTAIFRKNPEGITYDGGLAAEDAAFIRNAVKTVVFDDFATWSIGEFDPVASIEWEEISELTYAFTGTSTFASTTQISLSENDWMNWDGSTMEYTFSGPGNYNVGVIASSCGISDTTFYSITVGTVGVEELQTGIVVYPNPSNGAFSIDLDQRVGDLEYLEILDAEGRLIRSLYPGLKGIKTLTIAELQSGVYLLRAIKSGGAHMQRLVVAE